MPENIENRKARQKKYQLEHREEIYKKHREWIERNKEKQREYHKEYHKQWYEKNKEARRKEIKEYSKTHKADSVKRVQKYTAKNRDKVYEYGHRYNKTVLGKYRFYKSYAPKRGRDFTLTAPDFSSIVSNPCVYCGEDEKTRGIDRVDNSKGYTKENSASCCPTCNYMKKTMMVEDFLAHIQKIFKYNKFS